MMKMKVSDIKVKAGRRKADFGKVQELARSIDQIGLLNPITVDWKNNLVAGMHRLEAARQLGWTEIECTVVGLDGLKLELAEIDENVVRNELSALELAELLKRRKVIYEELNPAVKATARGGSFRGNQHTNVVSDKMSQTTKSFAQDTAEKLGVSKRTVERSVKLAADLSDKAKEYIQANRLSFTQKDLVRLSELPKDQQYEAVWWVHQGVIRNIAAYPEAKKATEDENDRSSDTNFLRANAQLRNPEPEKREAPPEELMDAYRSYVENFLDSLEFLNGERFTAAKERLTKEQLSELHEMRDGLIEKLDDFLGQLGVREG